MKIDSRYTMKKETGFRLVQKMSQKYLESRVKDKMEKMGPAKAFRKLHHAQAHDAVALGQEYLRTIGTAASDGGGIPIPSDPTKTMESTNPVVCGGGRKSNKKKRGKKNNKAAHKQPRGLPSSTSAGTVTSSPEIGNRKGSETITLPTKNLQSPHWQRDASSVFVFMEAKYASPHAQTQAIKYLISMICSSEGAYYSKDYKVMLTDALILADIAVKAIASTLAHPTVASVASFACRLLRSVAKVNRENEERMRPLWQDYDLPKFVHSVLTHHSDNALVQREALMLLPMFDCAVWGLALTPRDVLPTIRAVLQTMKRHPEDSGIRAHGYCTVATILSSCPPGAWRLIEAYFRAAGGRNELFRPLSDLLRNERMVMNVNVWLWRVACYHRFLHELGDKQPDKTFQETCEAPTLGGIIAVLQFLLLKDRITKNDRLALGSWILISQMNNQDIHRKPYEGEVTHGQILVSDKSPDMHKILLELGVPPGRVLNNIMLKWGMLDPVIFGKPLVAWEILQWLAALLPLCQQGDVSSCCKTICDYTVHCMRQNHDNKSFFCLGCEVLFALANISKAAKLYMLHGEADLMVFGAVRSCKTTMGNAIFQAGGRLLFKLREDIFAQADQ